MYDDSPRQSAFHDAAAIDRALKELTAADLGRLKGAARAWVRGFGLDAAIHGPDDLVSEAMFRTAQGRRRWRVGVDLVRHLIEVMHSIADSWRRSAERRGTEIRESKLIGGGFETVFPDAASPVRSAPSAVPGALRLQLGHEKLQTFLDHFAGDAEATAVLDGWWWGLTGPETQERAGLSKRRYVAAALRIRRYAQREGADHGD